MIGDQYLGTVGLNTALTGDTSKMEKEIGREISDIIRTEVGSGNPQMLKSIDKIIEPLAKSWLEHPIVRVKDDYTGATSLFATYKEYALTAFGVV